MNLFNNQKYNRNQIDNLSKIKPRNFYIRLNCFNLIVNIFLFLFSSSGIFAYQFVVGSMFRDEGRYLKEWIEYHKMIGVEHFFLYNDNSSDNWEEILSPYIREGVVEVFPWPTSFTGNYFENQVNAFRDGLQRSQNLADWFAFIDIDEFLLPMKEKNISDCLNKHFAEASAVYVNWRCFGSGLVEVPAGKPLLFELTQCSMKHHPKNCVGKSIIRPESADLEQLWYAHYTPLKPGCIYWNGDKQPMVFEESILKTDGMAHSDILRINHYVMRDKWYYENVRLARARNGYNGYAMPEEIVVKENEAFSLIKDYSIIRFIEKNYPEKKNFWIK